MSDYRPLPDVEFDHARARHLIDVASRIAHHLHAVATVEADAFSRAFRAWAGRARHETDEFAARHHEAVALAIQRLHQLVAALETAIDDALREQARRDALRARRELPSGSEQDGELSRGVNR